MSGVPPTEPGLDLSNDERDGEMPPARSSTIGTGSTFAIGCAAVTIAVIVIGIVFALFVR
jgi:hypothetical protein